MSRLIDRSAFLYMDPIGEGELFAQCSTCRFWRPQARLCAMFISEPQVEADSTCGLYVYGRPSDYQTFQPTVWPKDAGFETRQVRCENCIHYRPAAQACNLFYELNKRLPGVFRLNTQVHPDGCCNANTPSR